MYRLLLCWRYLQTRYIALASIISVTLGVATMIVVNSVMDGFTTEMHERMHGILSDVVVESHSSNGLPNPDWFEEQIRTTLGDDLAGLTMVVHVPAMATFDFRGDTITRQINLIGIDDKTYASVSDFSRFLMHPENRKQLSFDLRDNGYAPDRWESDESGWEHRRRWAKMQKAIQAERERNAELRMQLAEKDLANTVDAAIGKAANESTAADTANPAAGPSIAGLASNEPSNIFDPEFEQHDGVVLGVSVCSTRYRDANDEVNDFYYLRPGDDLQIAFASAGSPPRVINGSLTVVELYESKMSEYDATFAFMSLSRLQKMRGMIDPLTGSAAVSNIQLRLRDGADLDVARDKLRAIFPMDMMVQVSTWRDLQGPLLAAVQMETTILNILLFLIIAVAGFGILATFFMIVVEKTRDIGILKSLGAPSGGVASIFVAYGLLLGAVGSGVGAIGGLLFVWKINAIADVLEAITGREVFDPTIYYFDSIPTIVHPAMVVWVVIGAMLIAVLASVLPAIRAARLHPVEALRYE